MNTSFLDKLRPYLGRLIGSAVSAGAGYASMKYKFDVDVETQLALTTFITGLTYGVVHKLANKFLNPADSASTHLAVQGKVDAQFLKQDLTFTGNKQ